MTAVPDSLVIRQSDWAHCRRWMGTARGLRPERSCLGDLRPLHFWEGEAVETLRAPVPPRVA